MIADSSTLILLAKTGLLDEVLTKVKLGIPSKVKNESIAEKETFDAKLIEKRISEGKIEIKKIKNREIYRKMTNDFNLGKGEAEAIALNKEQGGVLLTDDKKAINVCKILNMEFTTALNVLERLYEKGFLSKEKAKASLERLNKYGRYSSKLIKKVRKGLK